MTFGTFGAPLFPNTGFFQTTLLNFLIGVSLHFESFAHPKVAAMAWLAGHFGSDVGELILLHNLGLQRLMRPHLQSSPHHSNDAPVAAFHFSLRRWRSMRAALSHAGAICSTLLVSWSSTRAFPSRWHLGALAVTFGGARAHGLPAPGHNTYVADAGTWVALFHGPRGHGRGSSVAAAAIATARRYHLYRVAMVILLVFMPSRLESTIALLAGESDLA